MRHLKNKQSDKIGEEHNTNALQKPNKRKKTIVSSRIELKITHSSIKDASRD